MKTVLLPVKAFADAKQRLVPSLDAPARAGLARAMLLDVLKAIAQARSPERIVIFSAAGEVIETATPFGFETVVESQWTVTARR